MPLVLANFVDRANVGMIQRGSGASLATKTFEGLGIACHGIRKELESNKAAELGIFGFIDDAHASAT